MLFNSILILLCITLRAVTVVDAWTTGGGRSFLDISTSRRGMLEQIQRKTTVASIVVGTTCLVSPPVSCEAKTLSAGKNKRNEEDASIAEQAGKAVFLAYIGFSTLAGVKGFYDFVQKKRQED